MSGRAAPGGQQRSRRGTAATSGGGRDFEMISGVTQRDGVIRGRGPHLAKAAVEIQTPVLSVSLCLSGYELCAALWRTSLTGAV